MNFTFKLWKRFCFRPLSRWIGSYTLCQSIKSQWSECFRPLARWIGSYTVLRLKQNYATHKFPSPLEVDRFLYDSVFADENRLAYVFPSPLEVDRFLYSGYPFSLKRLRRLFPSPLEVDRFLYCIIAYLPYSYK